MLFHKGRKKKLLKTVLWIQKKHYLCINFM